MTGEVSSATLGAPWTCWASLLLEIEMLATDNAMVATARMLKSGLKGVALFGVGSGHHLLRCGKSNSKEMASFQLGSISNNMKKHLLVELSKQALGKDRSWRRSSANHTPMSPLQNCEKVR